MNSEANSSIEAKSLVIKLVGAVLGGTLLGISFLSSATAFLVIFGLVIGILCFLRAGKIKVAALLGFCFGLSFFLIQSSWFIALSKFAGAWSYLGWVALSLIESMAFVLFAVATQVIHKKSKNNLLVAFNICFIFVSIEIIRSIGGWSYPWGLVGIGLVDLVPIAKIAALIGWPGLSFIAVFVSVLIAFAFLKKISIKQLIFFFLTLLLLFALWGQSPFKWKGDSPPTKVAILQTNVNMLDKWHEDKVDENLKELTRLVKKAPRETLLVAPESSLPGIYPENKRNLSILNKLASGKLIIGSLRNAGGRIYNSVLYQQRHYDKNNLVLLGENIPFNFLTGYIEPLRGSLTAGSSQKLIANTAVLICSESADWLYARKLVNKGADVVAVMTNDGWFKNSSLPYQHLQLTRLRAIENGRYVVMAANYGYSAIIKPNGEIIKKSVLSKSQVLKGTVTRIENKTFFLKYGYLATWLLLLLTCLITWYNIKVSPI